jgi:hypothetical protein
MAHLRDTVFTEPSIRAALDDWGVDSIFHLMTLDETAVKSSYTVATTGADAAADSFSTKTLSLMDQLKIRNVIAWYAVQPKRDADTWMLLTEEILEDFILQRVINKWTKAKPTTLPYTSPIQHRPATPVAAASKVTYLQASNAVDLPSAPAPASESPALRSPTSPSVLLHQVLDQAAPSPKQPSPFADSSQTSPSSGSLIVSTSSTTQATMPTPSSNAIEILPTTATQVTTTTPTDMKTFKTTAQVQGNAATFVSHQERPYETSKTDLSIDRSNQFTFSFADTFLSQVFSQADQHFGSGETASRFFKKLNDKTTFAPSDPTWNQASNNFLDKHRFKFDKFTNIDPEPPPSIHLDKSTPTVKWEKGETMDKVHSSIKINAPQSSSSFPTFGDNNNIIQSSTIPASVLTKRHNALAYHRVREAQVARVMYFIHIPGKQNPSDIFTKFLPRATFWPLVEPLLFSKGETLTADEIRCRLRGVS